MGRTLELSASSGSLATSARPAAESPSRPLAGAGATRQVSALEIRLTEARKWSVARRAAVATGVVLVIGALVAVLVTQLITKSHAPLTVPQTFTAAYRIASAFGGHGASAAGSVHKTLLPDGTWTVTGDVSVNMRNQTVKLVVANDGAAYYSVHHVSGQLLAQGCVTQQQLPRLDLLATALASASPLTAATSMSAACDAAHTWVVEFQGLAVTVCQTADHAFLIHGSGFSGIFSDINAAAPTISPFDPVVNATTGEPLQCPVLFPVPAEAASSRQLSTFFTSSCATAFPPCLPEESRRLDTVDVAPVVSRHLLIDASVSQSASLADTTGSVAADAAAAAAIYARCVFVHGAGVSADGATTSSFSSYWGNVHNAVSCQTRIFLHMNTVSRAWDSAVNAAAFCNAAATDSTGRIRNTVVFSHGSGNLIVAAGLAYHMCSFDSASSAWFELQGSYNAARLAEAASGLCIDYPYSLPWQADVNRDLGLCTGNDVALGWASLKSSYRTASGLTLNNMAALVKSSVGGAMCGTSATGLLGSSYWSVLSPFLINTSGDVAWSTCWDSSFTSFFQGVYGFGFYRATVNFLDVTCRNGDGTFGADRQPCQFFAAMTTTASSSL